MPNENEIENLVLNKFEEYIPRKFTIEVTEKCTLRCKYCLFSNQLSERHHSEIEMDDLTMKKAVDYYYLIYTNAFKRVSNGASIKLNTSYAKVALVYNGHIKAIYQRQGKIYRPEMMLLKNE